MEQENHKLNNDTTVISTVKELFPDVESDIILSVYKEVRSVELTIDHLLEMSIQTVHKDDVKPVSSSRDPKRKNWNRAVLNIPDNFLRIISDEDEFAIMLQNEEFLNELRFNQEFLSTLENEQGKVDGSFEEKLRNMSKNGKKKFFQLAKLFSFQRNKKISHFKQPLCDDK